MSRLVKKSPSVCLDLPLKNSDISNKLHLMMELLRSCYGPTARLKQVHNNIGGHVVTTSVSSVLLPAVSSSQPFINLIKTSIFNHVSRFSDCGLFAAIFCLSLIEQSKQSGLRENVVIRVNKHILAFCTNYLQREDCSCRVKLDFSSSQNLITLARSIISSKPACVLTEPEMIHISNMTVRAFLLTVPCNIPGTVSLGKIITVTIEGQPVLDSAVFPGLLIDISEDVCHNKVHSISNPLHVVLFSTSLAGDLPELGDGIIETYPGLDTESQIVDQLLEIGKQVVEDGVRLFVCQKVIHPVLQQYLRDHGVIVIERLGIALMEPLAQLAGVQPVATLHNRIPHTTYGKVRDPDVRQFGSRKMLHLHPAGESVVCTMILCHRNETMLNELKDVNVMNELKVVCQKTEHLLKLTLKEPCALLGGGCTETHLSAYVKHKSKNEASETASALGCSETEFLLGVEMFCRSLECVARSLEHDGGTSAIDLTHAHHWTRSSDVTKEHCGCGLVESCPSNKWTYLNTEYADFSPAPLFRRPSVQPRVLDSFAAKLSGMQVAVETANLALDVRFVIQDMN